MELRQRICWGEKPEPGSIDESTFTTKEGKCQNYRQESGKSKWISSTTLLGTAGRNKDWKGQIKNLLALKQKFAPWVLVAGHVYLLSTTDGWCICKR